jgi:single-strand DNA-binding protein
VANVNKVILIGNLTRDPELRQTPNTQTSICDFGIAVNTQRGRTADGQQREPEVMFIDVRAFGKQAEVIKQYLSKGRQIYIEGRLAFDQWTGQDGQKRSKHRILLENFQFLGDRDPAGGGGGGAPARAGGGGYQSRSGGPGGSGGGGYQNRGRSGPAPGPNTGPAPSQRPASDELPPDDYPPDDYGGDGPKEDNIPF